ncbi:MAG: ZIP family metal transporter [Clostridiales Family XIII bacterium]|jgi:ZIP family zinc transporter|nr:ZIP family metal transporter [Clostridiales Family XIII bacterium]
MTLPGGVPEDALRAFIFILLAGASTGIGSLSALFSKKTSPAFLAASLSFSAGVLLYVALAEIFSEAQSYLRAADGPGAPVAVGAFLAGMLFVPLIEKLLPRRHGCHADVPEAEGASSGETHPGGPQDREALLRTGFVTAVAIAVHNLPEGFAAFTVALREPGAAAPLLLAIGLHNIPLGVAISAPVYSATRDRGKSFLYAFTSGMAGPLGAVIGYLALSSVMDESATYVLLAAVAGIMTYAALWELLPAARAINPRLSLGGFVAGMGVMALCLLAL